VIAFCEVCWEKVVSVFDKPDQDQLPQETSLPEQPSLVKDGYSSQKAPDYQEAVDEELIEGGHFPLAFNCRYRNSREMKVGYLCQECPVTP
jgi:hypothetical protein